MKRKVQFILLIVFIGLKSLSQTVNVIDVSKNYNLVHTICLDYRSSFISELYISKSEKYLVILSDYKYVDFYTYGNGWQHVGSFKSNKFISVEGDGCGFSDGDKYFYVKYGFAYQHRQKVFLTGWSVNVKNYIPETDFDVKRYISFTDYINLEYGGYLFERQGADTLNLYIRKNLANKLPDKNKVQQEVPKIKKEVIKNSSQIHTDYDKSIISRGTESLAVSNNVEEVVNSAVNYHALIFANNQYHDPLVRSLDYPIDDATKLYNVLISNYYFEPKNVSFLKNATRNEMIQAFDEMSKSLKENDNLLIFYAGHGYWEQDKDIGYWLPSDAGKNSRVNWIRNSTIQEYIKSINTKHTMLVADACFSGSIFKTRAPFIDDDRAIKALYALPSRSAITSGNLKEVPDKSVFIEYLIDRLTKNEDKYLPADKLFIDLRLPVMRNSETEPQFGVVFDTGDEGGEFIFIRK